MQSEQDKNNDPQPPAQTPVKSVRITREPISQADIDEVSELYRKMVHNAVLTLQCMVKIGEKCCAMKARLPHGQWGRWARRNLPFTIRTATRAMQTFPPVQD